MYVYPFEKLNAWKSAKELTIQIYRMTGELPDTEKYGLVNQMRRAAISVCSNIAEGSSRQSSKDQAHFYTMAYSSLMELLNQSIISEELGFLKPSNYMEIRNKIEELSRMVYSLRNAAMN